MTIQTGSVKSRFSQTLHWLAKRRALLIAVVVLGLGVLFGWLINPGGSDSLEQSESVVSITIVVALLVIILHRPLDGVLVWIFFLPFLESYVNIPMGKGVPDLSFSRFLIAFLGISLLAKGATGQLRFSKVTLPDLFSVLTTAGIVAAAGRSIEPRPNGVIQMSLSLHFMPMVGYFFAKNLVRNRRDLKRLLWVIALLGAVSGAYAMYERITGNVLFLPKGRAAEGVDPYRASNIRMIRGIWGATGTIGRALALSIPITFYLWTETPAGRPGRLILLLMLGCEAVGLVISMARSPWYSTVMALFVMQFFYPKFRRAFVVILIVAVIVIWATWDQVTESQVAVRVGDRVSTLEGRQARWQAGFQMWWARPVRGWGFGRFARESGRFRQDGVRQNVLAVENDYLFMLVAAGLIAFVPYALFLLTPLVQSVRLFMRASSPEWAGLSQRDPDASRANGHRPAFIKRETIAVYWAVLVIFVVCSYTAVELSAGIKLITFTVAGAIVGSHEHILRTRAETRDSGDNERASRQSGSVRTAASPAQQ